MPLGYKKVLRLVISELRRFVSPSPRNSGKDSGFETKSFIIWSVTISVASIAGLFPIFNYFNMLSGRKLFRGDAAGVVDEPLTLTVHIEWIMW